MLKTNIITNLSISLSYTQLLSILKKLNIEQKIAIEKELEKDTLLFRAKVVSGKVKKNKLTLSEIVNVLKEGRKERYGKKK